MKPKVLTHLLGLCALLGVQIGLHAQDTLTKNKQQSLSNDIRILRAREEVKSAQATQKAMRTQYLPKFSITALAHFNASKAQQTLELGSIQTSSLTPLLQSLPQLAPMLGTLPSSINLPNLPYSLQTSGTYFASLTLTQPIYMGGKISSANRLADIGVEASQIKAQLTEAEVLLAMDEAYWGRVEVQELYKLAQAYVLAMTEAERVVSNAVEAGMRTRADLLRVQVELGNAELQLQQAKDAISLSEMNERIQFSNQPYPAQGEGQEGLETLSSDALPTQAYGFMPEGQIEARAEYRLLQKQIQAKSEEIKLAQSDYRPQLGLMASYSYLRGIKFNGTPLFDHLTPSLNLQLSIPLFNWGETQAKVRKARAEMRIAELQATEAYNQMALEQLMRRQKYTEQVDRLKLKQKQEEQAQELLRQIRNRYAVGLDTTTELLEAETLYQKAQTERVRTQVQLAIEYTRLLKAYGALKQERSE